VAANAGKIAFPEGDFLVACHPVFFATKFAYASIRACRWASGFGRGRLALRNIAAHNIDHELGELGRVARTFRMLVCDSLSVIRINPSPVTTGPLGVSRT
jgi:hypothetical protein